jgi:hypothetical protein
MRSRNWIIAVLASGLILVATACKKTEAPPPQPTVAPTAPQVKVAPTVPLPFKVVAVALGKQIGADKKVVEPVTAFAPTDTIYASVVSEGVAPKVELKARWTFEDGQLVDESSQTIAPTGPVATEFHVAKPSGWPTGKYTVTISADGTVVATKEFAVN